MCNRATKDTVGSKPPPRSHFPILPPRTLSHAITSDKRFSIRRIPGDRGIPLRFQLHQTPSAELRSHLHPESDNFLDRNGGNYDAEVHNDRTWTQLHKYQQSLGLQIHSLSRIPRSFASLQGQNWRSEGVPAKIIPSSRSRGHREKLFDHVFEPYPQGNQHSILRFIACYVGEQAPAIMEPHNTGRIHTFLMLQTVS